MEVQRTITITPESSKNVSVKKLVRMLINNNPYDKDADLILGDISQFSDYFERSAKRSHCFIHCRKVRVA
jgi:hypothetical protein